MKNEKIFSRHGKNAVHSKIAKNWSTNSKLQKSNLKSNRDFKRQFRSWFERQFDDFPNFGQKSLRVRKKFYFSKNFQNLLKISNFSEIFWNFSTFRSTNASLQCQKSAIVQNCGSDIFDFTSKLAKNALKIFKIDCGSDGQLKIDHNYDPIVNRRSVRSVIKLPEVHETLEHVLAINNINLI